MRYQIENGTVSLGGKTVLDHIDFSVKGREKIAVVGRNGAGKTTLLRLISGELSLDRDDKNFGKGIKTDRKLSIGFLHQQSFQDVEKTVEQEIISLINEEDIFSRERYYFEKEYDRIFTGFGFQKEDKKKKMKQFSGGEQTKLALIKLLLSKPDILLLDEPTNHLDIASVEWLEEYMTSYEKAVIMVSHDRFFVDRTTEIIYELADGKLTRYVGNYTEYKRQKEKQREVQQKKYDAQQKEIARLNELIEKFKHKPKKASMARSKKKVLERMQRVERPDKEEAYVFKEKLEPITLGAKNVLETEHLKIGYTIEHPIKELTLRIRRGQKIAVLGANGAGKSTFFKTIIGELPPISGKYVIGNGIMTGYFDQHSGEISSEKRVEEYFGECFPKLTEKEKRQVLGKYLFRSQKANMKISDLSGGEKSRLVLAEILESRPNFLVLDEPNSGLDPRSRKDFQLLLQRLAREDYTILISSHILSELADLCTSIGVINGGVMVQQGKLENIMLAIDSSNPLRITVLNQVPKALELLRQDPQVSRLSVDENKIAAWFSGSREEEAYLLQKLVDAGILVVSFAREHNSLESLFFHLTGETEQKSRNTETFGNTIG